MARNQTTFTGRDSWRQRVRLRGDLARLREIDPRLIEDIGFSLDVAEREIAKPFGAASLVAGPL